MCLTNYHWRVLQVEEAERAKEEEEASGIDPDMAAMMGFSGFGGSKKTWHDVDIYLCVVVVFYAGDD